MTQFRFKSENKSDARQEKTSGIIEQGKISLSEVDATDVMSLFVRLMGIIMLLIGLWMGVKVIGEAWALYRGPHHIERFADAIDQGSNLDKVLASFSAEKPRRAKRREGLLEDIPEKDNDTLRVSYFLAWIIVIFLLMLIGRLAMAAMKTGGELALYDLQVKKFARTLLEEVNNSEKRKR